MGLAGRTLNMELISSLLRIKLGVIKKSIEGGVNKLIASDACIPFFWTYPFREQSGQVVSQRK